MNVHDTPATQKTPTKLSGENIKNDIVSGQEDIPFSASLKKQTTKELAGIYSPQEPPEDENNS